MEEKLREIALIAEKSIGDAKNTRELEEVKVSLLGKKGELTRILKATGTLGAEERPVIGKIANETRRFIEEKLERAAEALKGAELGEKLKAETIDVTLPGRRGVKGHRHPMTLIIDEITEMFTGMGYTIAEGPEIEMDYYNFEALNVPANHPVKDEQDTFYINDKFLLRTQTSSVQIRTLEKKKPPVRVVAPGKVFRSDEPDATHTPVFHQCEGLLVDKRVTFGDLKGALGVVAAKVFGEAVKTRFRPSFFPFTEPSAEMDVRCYVCGGRGCPVCKDSGWVEVLGCGMVHPNVLTMAGVDPEEYSGFAFGMGLERIALSRFGINDIRLLFENDVRFLQQF